MLITDFAATRRKHIAWNISQNPTTITIHRKEKIRNGGGYEENEKDLPPVTVRIFVSRSQIPQTVSNLAGTKQTDKMYSLLADEHADIKAGPNVMDRFEALGETFEVISVQPQVVQGVTVGFQADLERVK
ncbi:hypothetical protein DMN77_18650 [Paenibacillus sp. 79R4]|uniref:hypothetical protein n=1 Tax=Paenibacillus sp. 79R4 TaxID=2212847 RepID=UPI0015BAD64E|nr:hypothetical protein [Paenibacillus sp. 79R4]NWL89571.1 hypothetical protein [Paenibacillus sp. 79R4]